MFFPFFWGICFSTDAFSILCQNTKRSGKEQITLAWPEPPGTQLWATGQRVLPQMSMLRFFFFKSNNDFLALDCALTWPLSLVRDLICLKALWEQKAIGVHKESKLLHVMSEDVFVAGMWKVWLAFPHSVRLTEEGMKNVTVSACFVAINPVTDTLMGKWN